MTGIPNEIAESREYPDSDDGFKIHRPQGHEDSTSSEAIKTYDASTATAPAPAQRKAQQFSPSIFVHSSASISRCGTYRYGADSICATGRRCEMIFQHTVFDAVLSGRKTQTCRLVKMVKDEKSDSELVKEK